jgi:hypothetical protein
MLNIKEHIKISKCITLALFVLFALSSCSARQSILSSFDIGFSGTLNKTRAAGKPINSCSFIAQKNDKGAFTRSVLKIADYQGRKKIDSGLSKWSFIATYTNKNTGLIPGSWPPKYILFKRLKVYLA